MKIEQIKDLIINMTIPEFGQPETPEDQLRRQGYERAKTLYAEEKIKLLKKI